MGRNATSLERGWRLGWRAAQCSGDWSVGQRHGYYGLFIEDVEEAVVYGDAEADHWFVGVGGEDVGRQSESETFGRVFAGVHGGLHGAPDGC